MGLQDGHQLLQTHDRGRRPSQVSFAESLPAYDDQRSPSYELHASSLVPVQRETSQAALQNPNWQTRLMLSTSGLGVAMSEESLRSLRYCLTWLRWANVHLGKVIVALKGVVEEWDQSQQHQQEQQVRLQHDRGEPPRYSIASEADNSGGGSDGSGGGGSSGGGDWTNGPDPTANNSNRQDDPPALLSSRRPGQPDNDNNNNDDDDGDDDDDNDDNKITSLIPASITPISSTQSEALARRVQELKSDVLSTLKKVVDIVSTYAGGALPDNARLLVRKHLTSLPERFHLASLSSSSSSPTPAPSLPPSSSSNPSGDGVNKDIAISGGSGETIGSAQRVLVLAREGLDMMAQVSVVLHGTIVRAEEWCERLGKKKGGEMEVEDERAAAAAAGAAAAG
ncbi:hypothetical protein GP486_008181, partial [Trichoglossum hirsutum]